MTTASRDPLEAIDRIRASIAYLRAGPESARWLGSVLDAYLAGAPEGVTVEQVAGLATLPGRLPWWRREAMQRRDDAFRRLATEHGLSAGDAAAMVQRYAAGRWRCRDSRLLTMPPEYAGTVSACLYEILASGEPLPESRSGTWRALRRVDVA